jgi:glyoxylase-like metal-dependent hydrolase (beta-lactamase superfamily II)
MHVYDTELEHPLVDVAAWLPSLPAERVSGYIWRSRSNSNSHLVASDDGDVVINTGTAYQGPRHRERYEQAIGRSLRVQKVIFTQSHADHIGGWQAFDDSGVERIAHERLFTTIAERSRVAKYLSSRRTAGMFDRQTVEGEPVTAPVPGWQPGQLPTVGAFVYEGCSLEVGARRFELFPAPGGETLDSLVVWLPDDGVAFTGNMTFAIPGGLPHLTTIRGDRMRSVLTFLECLDRVIALEPRVWCNGHGPHIDGAAAVRAALTKVRDATQYLHDATVQGMNDGQDLFTLMRKIELPPKLAPAHSRGPTAWCVRAIWEEYVGWFRCESVTELYGVPPSSVWGELTELAGGPDVLAERAAARLADGEPEQALHFTDMLLSVQPLHARGREIEISAIEALLRRSGAVDWDEARFLELELRRLRSRGPTEEAMSVSNV